MAHWPQPEEHSYDLACDLQPGEFHKPHQFPWQIRDLQALLPCVELGQLLDQSLERLQLCAHS